MKQRIYIAEDEKNIRETLQRFLENDGYEVCAFETGDALLGVFYKKRADLVILDIMMPGTDGLTCCRRIREKDKRRAAWHRFYTDEKWGDVKNYQICLDSGMLGIDRCAELLRMLY